MHFSLIDTIIEADAEHAVTLKVLSSAEEYLQDHFPTFPVLPGVLMLEAMVQSARHVLRAAGTPHAGRWVLGQAKALRYASMVRPADTMRVTVTLVSADAHRASFKGVAEVLPALGDTAQPRQTASGRFALRPLRNSTNRN